MKQTLSNLTLSLGGPVTRERVGKDSLREVLKMETKQIYKTVDSWILDEDLPTRASLKPLRQFDGLVPEDDEEREAYYEFISWYLSQEHIMLQGIPRPEEPDFWIVELDEFGNDISAFNTMDFERMHQNRFNKYHYKLKKIYERVKDLAITHSCVNTEEGKKNIKQRYINLVENEFRDEAVMLLKHYKQYSGWMDKHKTLGRIEELNSKIRKCKKIWSEYANWV